MAGRKKPTPGSVYRERVCGEGRTSAVHPGHTASEIERIVNEHCRELRRSFDAALMAAARGEAGHVRPDRVDFSNLF